ncbi:MAG: AAA family ATPase [Prevotella sp.]|nr:AAA family ATPase [Prevotella sp.]
MTEQEALKMCQEIIDNAPKENYGIFVGEDFNPMIKRVKNEPNPKQLFLSLFYENELAILFGPTNCGKSLFAIMIAEATCSVLTEQGDLRKVLYFDMEMSDKQQQMRYTDPDSLESHVFPATLKRITISEESLSKITEQSLLEGLEKAITETKASVVVFDNITFLNSRNQKAEEAADLMQKLKGLTRRLNVSILVLAHTPKRIATSSMTLNDLMGSSLISAFADSVFVLNKSCKGKDYRYVKQLKARSSEIEYGAENVLVYVIERAPDGRLYLRYTGTSHEDEHLPKEVDSEREALKSEVMKLADMGKTQREIAEELGTSAATVNRLLNPKPKPK